MCIYIYHELYVYLSIYMCIYICTVYIYMICVGLCVCVKLVVQELAVRKFEQASRTRPPSPTSSSWQSSSSPFDGSHDGFFAGPALSGD